jgi:hypothetical protein
MTTTGTAISPTSYALSVGRDGLAKLGPAFEALYDATGAPVAGVPQVRVYRPSTAGHGVVKPSGSIFTLSAAQTRALWGLLVVADAAALHCLPLERLHQLLRDVNANGSSVLTGDGLDGIDRSATDVIDPAHLGGEVILGDGTLISYDHQTGKWGI